MKRTLLDGITTLEQEQEQEQREQKKRSIYRPSQGARYLISTNTAPTISKRARDYAYLKCAGFALAIKTNAQTRRGLTGVDNHYIQLHDDFMNEAIVAVYSWHQSQEIRANWLTQYNRAKYKNAHNIPTSVLYAMYRIARLERNMFPTTKNYRTVTNKDGTKEKVLINAGSSTDRADQGIIIRPSASEMLKALKARATGRNAKAVIKYAKRILNNEQLTKVGERMSGAGQRAVKEAREILASIYNDLYRVEEEPTAPSAYKLHHARPTNHGAGDARWIDTYEPTEHQRTARPVTNTSTPTTDQAPKYTAPVVAENLSYYTSEERKEEETRLTALFEIYCTERKEPLYFISNGKAVTAQEYRTDHNGTLNYSHLLNATTD